MIRTSVMKEFNLKHVTQRVIYIFEFKPCGKKCIGITVPDFCYRFRNNWCCQILLETKKLIRNPFTLNLTHVNIMVKSFGY